MTKIAESFKNFYPLATDFYIEIFDKKEIVLTGNVEVTELDDSVLKIKCNEHGLIFSGKNIFLFLKSLLCGLSCCSAVKFYSIKFLY